MANPGAVPADDPRRIAEWRERVKRYEASGMKAADFAKREGVKTKQLTWWLGEFRRLEEGRPRRGRPRKEAVVAPNFVALKVTQATSSPLVTAPIEVVLRSGLALRISSDFDEVMLRRLVSTLEGA